MTADTPAPSRNGLAIAWDVIVAPKAAFTALRAQPTWLIAFLIVVVLGTIGAILQQPAGIHIVQTDLPARFASDPNLAGMSAEKQQQIINQSIAVQRWTWPFYFIIALIGVSFAALILLIGKAIGRGSATFGQLFALAMNVAIVNFGIAYFFIGVIVAIKGGAAFNTQRDLLGVLPSLAWLAPGAGPKLAGFLSSFGVFSLWSAYLLMLGMQIVTGVSRAVAIGTAAVLLLVPALLAASFAK